MSRFETVIMNIRSLLKKWFKPRRIIVVSDAAIFTIHLHPWFQGSVAAVAFVLTAWMVYASGQFVVFETLLTTKEGEIVHATKANKNLVAQMDELQKHLQTLNKYLKSSPTHGHQTADAEKGDKRIKPLSKLENKGDSDKELNAKVEQLSEQTNSLLNEIYDNVSSKIDTVEDGFDVAGLDLDNLNVGDQKLVTEKKGIVGQGGPFIPLVSKLFSSQISPSMLQAKVDYLMKLETLARSLPFARPMPSAGLSSGFGVRRDPMTNILAIHKGLDFVGPEGGKVYTTGDGRVLRAGRYGAYGRFVEIYHGNGVSTRYGHLSQIFVRNGQRLRRGQVIGLQGSTGRSTGSHLHYEVRVDGDAVDPKKFLKAGTYVF